MQSSKSQTFIVLNSLHNACDAFTSEEVTAKALMQYIQHFNNICAFYAKYNNSFLSDSMLVFIPLSSVSKGSLLLLCCVSVNRAELLTQKSVSGKESWNCFLIVLKKKCEKANSAEA